MLTMSKVSVNIKYRVDPILIFIILLYYDIIVHMNQIYPFKDNWAFDDNKEKREH